jgi:hypothetical protein
MWLSTEHEVIKVTSGRRVAVTYNLYLVDLASRPGVPAVTANLKPVLNLQIMLKGLLKSPEFLPTAERWALFRM